MDGQAGAAKELPPSLFGLPQQDIIVTTDVDRLVDLLKARREIAVKEAAETLGVSIETVESWVGFLEEEGIVSLSYKFTTPFIMYLEPEVEEVVAAPAKPQGAGFFILQEGDAAKQQAGQAREPEQQQEPAMRAVEIQPEAQPMFRPVAETQAASQPISISVDVHLRPPLQFQQAEQPAQGPRMEQQQPPRFRQIEQPPQPFQQAEQPPLAQRMQPQLAPAAGIPPFPTGTDVRDLVGEAYSHIKSGDLEKARHTYTRVRAHLESIPDEKHEERKEVEHHLIKLNRDLSVLMKEAALSYAGEIEAEMAGRIHALSMKLSKGRLGEAEREYREVERLYADYPQELLMRKLALQSEILEQYRQLLKKKRAALQKECSRDLDELFRGLKRYRDLKGKGDAKGAEEAFRGIRALYLALPESALSKEMVLGKEIIKTAPELLPLRKQGGHAMFSQKEREMRKLVSFARKHVEGKNAPAANTVYQRLQRIFASLPKGFDSERLSLLADISDIHARMIPLLADHLAKEFRHKSAELQKHIKLARRYLEKDRIDLARDIYREAVVCFNAMPAGFLVESTDLKVHLLTLYKELLVRGDISLIGHLSKPAEKVYSTILAILVNVHAHVENEEFEHIEQDSRRLDELFAQLPLSLDSQKSRIGEEVAKVRRMVELYKGTQRLQGLDYSSPGQKEAIREQLASIKRLYEELSQKDPEDASLYRYVYGISTAYLAALKEGVERIPPPGMAARKEQQPPSSAREGQDRLDEHERQTLSFMAPTEMYGRAVLYLNEEKLGKARECLDHLLRQAPQDEQARRLLNEVNALQSKKDLTSLLLSLKLDRARHALALDDREAARLELREALAMDPDNREASALLSKLPRAAQGAQPAHPEEGRPQAGKAPLKEMPAADAAPHAEARVPAASRQVMPPPPPPPLGDEAALLEERRGFLSSQRLKEARLALSEGDAAKAEEKLLETLKVGPSEEATGLLNRLRGRAAPTAKQEMPPPPPAPSP